MANGTLPVVDVKNKIAELQVALDAYGQSKVDSDAKQVAYEEAKEQANSDRDAVFSTWKQVKDLFSLVEAETEPEPDPEVDEVLDV